MYINDPYQLVFKYRFVFIKLVLLKKKAYTFTISIIHFLSLFISKNKISFFIKLRVKVVDGEKSLRTTALNDV